MTQKIYYVKWLKRANCKNNTHRYVKNKKISLAIYHLYLYAFRWWWWFNQMNHCWIVNKSGKFSTKKMIDPIREKKVAQNHFDDLLSAFFSKIQILSFGVRNVHTYIIHGIIYQIVTCLKCATHLIESHVSKGNWLGIFHFAKQTVSYCLND